VPRAGAVGRAGTSLSWIDPPNGAALLGATSITAFRLVRPEAPVGATE
jgi:hypothetical protein